MMADQEETPSVEPKEQVETSDSQEVQDADKGEENASGSEAGAAEVEETAKETAEEGNSKTEETSGPGEGADKADSEEKQDGEEKTGEGEDKKDEEKKDEEKKEGEEKKDGEGTDGEAKEGEEANKEEKKDDDDDSDSDDDLPKRSKPPARAPPARPPPRIDPNAFDRATWSSRPEITRTWEVEEAPNIEEPVVVVDVDFSGTKVAENYDVSSDVLGRGPFSVVKRGKRKSDGVAVAIKGVSTTTAPDISQEAVSEGAKVLEAIGKHDNIVSVLDSYKLNDTTHAFVLELAEKGELIPHIISDSTYTEATARGYARALFSALDLVHSKGYVHRDVVYENLLLSSGGTLQLGGFTLTKACGDTIDNDGICGSPETQAPEIVQHQAFGNPVDLWASGCIIYLLLSGRLPFYDANTMRLNMKIRKGQFEFPSAEFGKVSSEGQDLIKKLLVVEPKDRLTASQALSHAWFSSSSASALPSVSTNLKKLLEEQQQ